MAAAFIAAVMALTSQPVLAELPKIQYSTNESVGFEWLNQAPSGTIEPGNVSFRLKFNSKSNGMTKYKVTCTLDGKSVVNEYTEVAAAAEEDKTYSFSADAGIHSVSVSVSKNGSSMYDKTEDIYLVKSYEKQPMDELSGRGINVHYERKPYKDDIGFVNDLMNYAGLKTVRLGQSWEYIEKKKGVYDFSELDKYYGYLKEHGMNAYWCSGYGNGWLYLPERGMSSAAGWSAHTRNGFPQTQESIKAYTKNMIEVAKENIKRGVPFYLEGWNEINGGSRNPDTIAQVYNDFTQPVRLELIREGLDDEVEICGYTPHNNNINEFLNASMYQGFYPYFDRYAAHTYQFKNGFESSNLYDIRMQGHDDFITEWGGWKFVDMTETGFTTPASSNANSTLESANEEIAKLFTICEYNNINQIMVYDLMNDGTDASYTEDNFGAVTYDGKPKPHYLAMTNFNNQTSGGTLIGEIDTGLETGTRAFLYYKDGEPVVIAWSNLLNGGGSEWKLSGETVDVYDNYGNAKEQAADSVMLDREPVYIHGMSRDWIRKAVLFDTQKLNSAWLEKFSDGVLADTISEIKNIFTSAENALSGDVDAEQAAELIESYKKAGSLLIADGRDGKLAEVEVSKRLYRLFRIAEKINKLYMAEFDGDAPAISARYDETYQKAKELYLDEVQIKQYSDAMLNFAREYHKNSERVADETAENKPGYIASANNMVEFICDWFDEFSAYENLTDIGLQIQTPYYDRKSYVNTDVQTEVNLNNYSNEDFSGTICVFDEEGNEVYETPQLKVKANGGYTQTSITVNTARPKDDIITYYDLAYVDKDGNVLKTQKTAYEVKDRFEVSMLPCSDTPENLKTVRLKIKNLTDTRQDADIKLESDSSFAFKSNDVQVSIEANEEKVVDLPVANVENNKYHFHSFSYTVSDEKGNVVAQKDAALSFPKVVKAQKTISAEDFDGDISDWQDAYPIYINTPQNITKSESWQNAECSARAFFKWDEEHLYCLVDIYDDAFLQPFTGGSMWQGDSIQISVDADDDKATSYQSDDYELGFSHTPLGHEFYYWYAPQKLETGVVDWFKMIRNDDMHFSRYLIAMDKLVLPTLKFQEGAKYGLNIALNDNDYLEREGIYQFTRGTADQKNPSLYADFELISANGDTLSDGIAESIFPTSVESKISDTKKAEYSDISGHWAEDIITSMSGFVSGMGDGSFAPDKEVTRAEFFSLLKRAANLSDGEEAFSDTDRDSWYYGAAASVKKLVPDAMLGENGEIMPDKAVTREEAVYLMSECIGDGESVDCSRYPDGADVSDWAADAVGKALGAGLIKGSDDGNLYPKAQLTRAQAAVMIYNLLTIK